MKRSFLPVRKILVATIAGMSFAAMVGVEATLADPNQPFNSLESDRNSNSLSGGGDFNILDLMHQSQIGTVQWNADEQNQQLDQAAAAFIAAQQKLLQPQQTQAGTSAIAPGQNIFPLEIVPSSPK
jgi:hypothetical protein